MAAMDMQQPPMPPQQDYDQQFAQQVGDPSAEKGDARPLSENWTIWFDKQAKRKTKGGRTIYEDCIVELGSFNTTQGFWAYWHSLQVQNLKEHCNLRIFKKGIKPLWEDPLNIDGGKWVVRGVGTQRRRELWTAMVTALIADELRDGSDHHVCGAVLSTREGGDSMQLWVDGGTTARRDGTTQQLLAERAGWGNMDAVLGSRFFPVQEHRFIYQTHRELQSHQKPQASQSPPAQVPPSQSNIPTMQTSPHIPNPQPPPQQIPPAAPPPVPPPPPPPPPSVTVAPQQQQILYGVATGMPPTQLSAVSGAPQGAGIPLQQPHLGVQMSTTGIPNLNTGMPIPVPMPLAPQHQQPMFVQQVAPQPKGMNPAAAPYAPPHSMHRGHQMQHGMGGHQNVNAMLLAPHGIPMGDDDEDEFQDPGADAPPAIRAIHERAKQIRTLRKKVRYINFFLTRQSRGRELTQQEKGRVRSLPFLQRELQLLEEEQTQCIEAQKQELGLDTADFMRKRQQPMTYATEEERRFKTTRAIRKKIRFIHYHLERQREGKQLSPAELVKVNSLPELEQRLAELEAEEAAAQASRPPEEQQATEQTTGGSGEAAAHQIATLQAQIDAQRRELEEKQRHIESLQRQSVRTPTRTVVRQGVSPLSPDAVGIAMPAVYGHNTAGVLNLDASNSPYSPGGGGPPVLESPPLSPPMSPEDAMPPGSNPTSPHMVAS